MKNEISDNADLALAAYAILNRNLATNHQVNIDALKFVGMTDLQARAFATRWPDIKSFQEDSASGLAFTVFRNGNNVNIAVRGTELSLNDILNDLTLGAGRIDPQYIELRDRFTALKSDGVIKSSDSLTVAGHSLGGYLSQLLIAEYTADFEQAYIYNSPGAFGVVAGLFNRIFDAIGILPPNVPSNLIQNIQASGDPVSEVGIPQGSIIDVNIEKGSLGENHSSVRLADALNVFDALSSYFPSFTIDNFNAFVNASGTNEAASFEDAINVIGDFFGAGSSIGLGDRDALYQRLSEIKNELFVDANADVLHFKPQYAGASFVGLSEFSSPDELAQSAISNIAYKYAIDTLSPFALLNVDALYVAKFAENNTDFDTLTDEYLTDRAHFLYFKLKLNQEEGVAEGPLTDFKDLETGEQIFTGRSVDNTDQVTVVFGRNDVDVIDVIEGSDAINRIYGQDGNDIIDGKAGDDYIEGGQGEDIIGGGDGDDVILGGADNDRLVGNANNDTLYGQSGDDTLIGGDGIDTLIGGAGNDTLEGGLGFDTYDYNSGDGIDTIDDSDGRVVFDGVELTGGELNNDRSLFISADQNIFYQMVGTDLIINDVIIVKNFEDGYLGIQLTTDDSIDEEESITTYAFGHATFYGYSVRDIYYGNSSDNNAYGMDGNDTIYGYWGDDNLFGGAGDDTLWGGSESDYLYGGVGDDKLSGGNDDDYLYGEMGDDWIWGGDGNDYIDGGGGSDFLQGQGGDDTYLLYVAPQNGGVEEVQDKSGNEVYQLADGLVLEDLLFHHPRTAVTTSGDTTVEIYIKNDIGGFAQKATVIANFNQGDALILPDGQALNYLQLLEIAANKQGSDFADILFGTPSQDTIFGNDGDDLIKSHDGSVHVDNGINNYYNGGAGNDSFHIHTSEGNIEGGKGNDDIFFSVGENNTVIWNVGDGNDEISGHTAYNITLGDSIEVDDVIVYREWGNSGNNPLNLQYSKTGEILQLTNSLVNNILFHDGSVLNNFARTYHGNNNDDQAVFSINSEAINFYGFGGNDYIDTGKSNDILDGGEGNDLLFGNDGNDTYQYRVGDGNDVIKERSGLDTLVLEEINQANVSFSQSVNDLMVTTTSNSQTITIKDWFVSPDNQIETFEFNDATLNASQVEALIPSVNAPPEAPIVNDIDVTQGQVLENYVLPEFVDDDPLTYELLYEGSSNLPVGLTFDPTTHSLSGEIVGSGDYQFTYTATDTQLETDTVTFTLNAAVDAAHASAVDITISVDDKEEVYFNGALLGTSSQAHAWRTASNYVVNRQEGANVLSVKATDTGGIAGLIAQLQADGQTLNSNGTWKVSTTYQEGWQDVGFNDGNWVEATTHGVYGDTPWNKNVSGLSNSSQSNWIWSSDNDADNEVYFRYEIDYAQAIQPSIINGTSFDDVLVGTEQSDVINGLDDNGNGVIQKQQGITTKWEKLQAKMTEFMDDGNNVDNSQTNLNEANYSQETELNFSKLVESMGDFSTDAPENVDVSVGVSNKMRVLEDNTSFL